MPTRFHRICVYQAVVSLAALLATLVLLAVTRHAGAATAGFAVLALLGLAPLLFRSRGDAPLEDERDQLNRRRSVLVAYSVFWVVFVLTSVALVLRYGDAGCVPVEWLMWAAPGAFCLVTLVQSVAGLALDRWAS